MWKGFLLGGLLVVVLSATATATALLLQVENVNKALKTGHLLKAPNELTRPDVGGAQTIMLLGSDHRSSEPGKAGNSDTILLVRLDPDKQATALMSVPRDRQVDLKLPNGRIKYGDKINDAYAQGGPRLAIRTVRETLGIDINHVIDINFGGFRHAVNRVGCIYTDVDRRYFNDNLGPGAPYAQINIQPGYQKLCDYDALAYVRYRHADTDIVRAARQQDFLRQAKNQLSAQKLFDDRDSLIKIFAKYADTDIRGTGTLIELGKLVAFSAGHPMREVHFRSNVGPSYVTATPLQLEENRQEFLNEDVAGSPVSHPKRPPQARRATSKRQRGTKIPGGLERAATAGEDQGIVAARKVTFPFFYPTLRLAGSVYDGNPRTYVVKDLRARPHHAYRMVLDKGSLGDFYGVQGMSWKNPPILDKPSGTQVVNGRRMLLYSDGGRLRTVAWRTARAVYWVSNTLTLSLNNDQMLAIAGSLRTFR
jgi:LCP family protein required for cell wall assembly